MILDVSPAGRSRMRRSARFDVDAWCEREEIGPEIERVEFLGRHVEGGFEVRLSRGGNKRRQRRFVKEYPPATCWWYMTDGDGQ